MCQLPPAPVVLQVPIQVDLNEAEEGPARVHGYAVPEVSGEACLAIRHFDLAAAVDGHGQLHLVLVVVAHLKIVRVPGRDDRDLRIRLQHKASVLVVVVTSGVNVVAVHRSARRNEHEIVIIWVKHDVREVAVPENIVCDGRSVPCRVERF